MSLLAIAPARLVRVATAAFLATTAACGGDEKADDREPTSPTASVVGAYQVASVNGGALPSGMRGSFEIRSGNTWRMTLSDATGSLRDTGTYTGSGSSLTFTSEEFGDQFDGSIADGRLTIRYDMGNNEIVRFTFQK